MQSKDLMTSLFELEFEISGENLDEFNCKTIHNLSSQELKIAQSIHKAILQKAQEIVSLGELKIQITKNLNFIDLVKVKLDFSEKGGGYNEKLSPFDSYKFQ